MLHPSGTDSTCHTCLGHQPPFTSKAGHLPRMQRFYNNMRGFLENIVYLAFSVKRLVCKHPTWIFLVCLSRSIFHLSLGSESWKADLDALHQWALLSPGFQLAGNCPTTVSVSIGRHQPEQNPEGRRRVRPR